MKGRSCGKESVFVRTDKGGVIPVDAETADFDEYAYDKNRHITHFATCPDANKFRKGKG